MLGFHLSPAALSLDCPLNAFSLDVRHQMRHAGPPGKPPGKSPYTLLLRSGLKVKYIIGELTESGQ